MRATREPRSLLGYHEFARKNDASGLRRARARAGRRARRGPLGRRRPAERAEAHPRRRACSRAACRIAARCSRTGCASAIAAAPSSTSTTPTTSRRSSPTSTCTCSAKATTTRIYYKLGAHPADARRPRRHALRRVGAERRARQRRRAVQPLGRPQARDADARRAPASGSCSSRTSGPARSTSTRSARAAGARCSRPTRTASRCSCGPDNCSIVASLDGYEWQDEAWMRGARRADPLRAADQHLRSASRLWRRDYERTPQFLNWRELADELIPYVHGPGLHARRADGRGRASVRRLVGLPGRRATTRRRARFGIAAGLHALRRPLPPGRHRRDHRLGARALPARRARPRELRRHGALRARRPAARRARRLGHEDLQLRPARGAQLPRGERAVLARPLPRRRPARGCGRLDAVPRLQPQGRRVGAEPLRRPREPRRDRVPAPAQHRGRPRTTRA